MTAPTGPEVDLIAHPLHYTQGAVECIDAIRSALTPIEFAGFLKGVVIQYLWRDGAKDGAVAADRAKASWYLDQLQRAQP